LSIVILQSLDTILQHEPSLYQSAVRVCTVQHNSVVLS